MSKNILALAVVLVLVLAGGYFALTKYSGNNTPTPTTESTSAATPTTSESSSSANMNQVTVKVTANGYEPKSITIKAGQTVVWMNEDTKIHNISSDPHPTHTNYPPLNIGNIIIGKEVSLTFPTKGTYSYHDHLQPSRKGTVIVQ